MTHELAWRIEETCFNAFPALKQVFLGGWLLRFSEGLSRRANSVNPLRPGGEPGEALIAASEGLYRRQALPAIFRVPTIIAPELDERLAAGGYAREGDSCVLFGPIEAVAAAPDPAVRLLASPEPEWCAAMAGLQRHTPEQSAVYRRIVGLIAVPAAFAALPVDGEAAALAYGAVHDGLLCYESVVTAAAHRRRGCARRVIGALAAWARQRGATGVCLQVEATNAPARALYHGFGLKDEAYRYHYRREPRQG